jgi:small subunit ribosomal protein S20
MAITKSAKKAHRASLKKHVFNLRRKRALTTTTKAVKKLVTAGDTKEATTSLSAAYKAIDKAAKRGVIKKNTASRKKSRLAASIRRVEVKA